MAVCPRCNAQLGMGVAPINEFMRAGLRLGMGTDSPAATDSTDMLTEMRIGMLVQRAVNVGEFLDSATMLEMATIGGARALKLDDKIGSLEIGKLADIIAVSYTHLPLGWPVPSCSCSTSSWPCSSLRAPTASSMRCSCRWAACLHTTSFSPSRGSRFMR